VQDLEELDALDLDIFHGKLGYHDLWMRYYLGYIDAKE
jgi:hypothetical protein